MAPGRNPPARGDAFGPQGCRADGVDVSDVVQGLCWFDASVAVGQSILAILRDWRSICGCRARSRWDPHHMTPPYRPSTALVAKTQHGPREQPIDHRGRRVENDPPVSTLAIRYADPAIDARRAWRAARRFAGGPRRSGDRQLDAPDAEVMMF